MQGVTADQILRALLEARIQGIIKGNSVRQFLLRQDVADLLMPYAYGSVEGKSAYIARIYDIPVVTQADLDDPYMVLYEREE